MGVILWETGSMNRSQLKRRLVKITQKAYETSHLTRPKTNILF